MRYGWLKKSYDAVRAGEGKAGGTQTVFSADDAIATLGVGRNMVRSMRHWSLAAGVLESPKRPFRYREHHVVGPVPTRRPGLGSLSGSARILVDCPLAVRLHTRNNVYLVLDVQPLAEAHFHQG